MERRAAAGAVIRAELGRNACTRTDLAYALGINRATLSNKISGRNSFDLDELAAAAAFFRLSLTELAAAIEDELAARVEGAEL